VYNGAQKRYVLKKLIFIIILSITFVQAHPHTFIDVYPTLHVKGDKIVKTHIKWKMDDMSSAMLIMEFDTNGNGKIDEKENVFIYENYFLSLIKYHFYMDVVVKNKITTLPNPKNFIASIEDNRVCYSFDIDKTYTIKETKFDFYDKEFFVAMMLKKEFVKVENREVNVSGKDMDFYYMYRLELK
jgi:ABC-type uncharacterized transport system substrate-binding protein